MITRDLRRFVKMLFLSRYPETFVPVPDGTLGPAILEKSAESVYFETIVGTYRRQSLIPHGLALLPRGGHLQGDLESQGPILDDWIVSTSAHMPLQLFVRTLL